MDADLVHMPAFDRAKQLVAHRQQLRQACARPASRADDENCRTVLVSGLPSLGAAFCEQIRSSVAVLCRGLVGADPESIDIEQSAGETTDRAVVRFETPDQAAYAVSHLAGLEPGGITMQLAAVQADVAGGSPVAVQPSASEHDRTEQLAAKLESLELMSQRTADQLRDTQSQIRTLKETNSQMKSTVRELHQTVQRVQSAEQEAQRILADVHEALVCLFTDRASNPTTSSTEHNLTALGLATKLLSDQVDSDRSAAARSSQPSSQDHWRVIMAFMQRRYSNTMTAGTRASSHAVPQGATSSSIATATCTSSTIADVSSPTVAALHTEGLSPLTTTTSSAFPSAQSAGPFTDRLQQSAALLHATSLRAQQQLAAETAARLRASEEASRLEAQARCIVCCARDRTMACVPCGHVSMCGRCAESCQRAGKPCPICRQAMLSLMRVYVA